MSRAVMVARTESPRSSMPSQRQWAWLLALGAPLILGPAWMALLGTVPALEGLANSVGLILLLLLSVCTCTDLRRGKIPNWATYPAFLWAVLINLLASAPSSWQSFLSLPPLEEGPPAAIAWQVGPVGLGECLLGGAACFAVMFAIYRMAGGGAGDVKLAAAIGALLGVERGFNALVVSYIIAGTAIVGWVIWTIGPLTLLSSLARKVGSLMFPLWVMPPTEDQSRLLKRPVPLAVFFGLGTLAVVGGVVIPW